MRRGKYLGVITLVLATVLVLPACAKSTVVKTASSAAVDPYRGWEVHGEMGLYEVRLPPGWTKTVDDSWLGSRTVSYTDADGNFFSVLVPPLATEYYADRLWELNWADNAQTAFRVVNEGQVCVPDPQGEHDCALGDGKTQIHAMLIYGAPKGVSVEVQFDFGNTTAETAQNDDLYRKILASFRIVKAVRRGSI